MTKLIHSLAIAGLTLGAGALTASASSHREAPAIAEDQYVDNTDVYAFISPNNAGNLVIVANYVPLQGPAGGQAELSADGDYLTDEWQPRLWAPNYGNIHWAGQVPEGAPVAGADMEPLVGPIPKLADTVRSDPRAFHHCGLPEPDVAVRRTRPRCCSCCGA